mmetsp:Transcript_10013/g.11255  ORF Transcript_10013/g.11255 Transcript_10013/m.11255 type:complete len:256 (+) Transcript_10013:307-1074(+)
MFDYIAQTSAFPEEIARYYLHQIVDAFDYMNQKGITHRDMKPDNLLFDSEFNIKISDFGWASNKTYNTTEAGTVQYMAPEIYICDKYNGKCVDIFAVAVILFIMVAQHPPFVKPDPKDRHYNAICANRDDLFWKWHTKSKSEGIDFFSESFRNLISQMLSLDPVSRPSLAEIRSHEWYNLPVPSKEEVIEELKSRRTQIDKAKLKLEETKNTDSPDPNVFIKNVNHRDLDNPDAKEIVSTKREVEEYVPEAKSCT